MLRIITILCFIIGITSCTQKQHKKETTRIVNTTPLQNDSVPCLTLIEKAYFDGNFTTASALISNCLQHNNYTKKQTKFFLNLSDRIERTRKEFTLNKRQVTNRLKIHYPELDTARITVWEKKHLLEMRLIDGEKMYYKNAISNFFRLIPNARKRFSKAERFCETYTEAHNTMTGVFDKRKMEISYIITVAANTVPDNETIRCWLPFPRKNSPRLNTVRLLYANDSNYIIAPDTCLQRSIYLEKKAIENQSTTFSIRYSIETTGQYFNLDSIRVKPYNTSSAIYRKYTKEQFPHIVFSDTIQHLAQYIIGNSTNPREKVKKLLMWLNQEIPWASALEYSTMDCIPEYVLRHKRGDCGMQTFLFLSMARSLGIPCKWQSGWYLYPTEKNLHDWAEVYYEGVGWVPVDPSIKLPSIDRFTPNHFYHSGMDSYRLIVNDGVAAELFPKKQHYRSEPFDFQRGELEWQGGNLYFDKWKYNLQVKYIQ